MHNGTMTPSSTSPVGDPLRAHLREIQWDDRHPANETLPEYEPDKVRILFRGLNTYLTTKKRNITETYGQK